MEYKISSKLVDMKPSAIREIFKSLTDPSIIAFAAGNPAAESFPKEDLAALSEEIFRDNAVQALQYSVTEGYPALRAATSARIKAKFSAGGPDDMLIITSGGQQGIELTCKVMCDQGDAVIAENPSFIGALNAFRSIGARIVGVPLCEDGMDIDALEAALKANPRTKFIYVISNFQNPAGLTTSLEKRRAIYALARKYDTLILEDNPYGELRFEGEDIPTIKSMDTDGRVLYCGSYSKILSAGMRVGFLCGPSAVMQKVVVAKQVEDVHTNIFFQMLCEKYMRQRDIDSHVAAIRVLYHDKCRLMLSQLDKLDCGLKFTRPQGGLFVWCTLPRGIALDDFVQGALKRKLAVVPGTAFNCDEHAGSDSFRITYSTPTPDQITRGCAIIGETIASLRK